MRKSLSVEPGSSAISPPACFLRRVIASRRAVRQQPCRAWSFPKTGISFRDHAPLALTAFHRYISAEIPTFPKGQGRMARQFIYHMQGLTKTYPPNRKVLENINLSFYPDAKIGVLGVNGSGKSTLLRIMAGIDTEFAGEAWAAEGARVGYLEQEPQLEAAQSVRDNVMEGVAPQQAILDSY